MATSLKAVCSFMLICFVLNVAICFGAEEINYYEKLSGLWEKSTEEGERYVDTLSSAQLLIMGRQACEHNPEALKKESPFMFVPMGIISKWLEKSEGKPDIDRLINILKDKNGVEGWRTMVGYYLLEYSEVCLMDADELSETGFGLTQEDGDRIFVLLNDDVLFWDELPLLRAILCENLEEMLGTTFSSERNKTPDSPKLTTLMERIEKNISSLYRIINDTNQPKDVIEAAMSSLRGYRSRGLPQEKQIEAELLKVYANKDKYDEETRKLIEKRLKKLVEEAESQEKPETVTSVSEEEPLNMDGVITNTIGMKLKLIEAGEFMMGSDGGKDDKKPVQKVKITKPFYIGVYEVTQAQYEKIMGENPSHFKSPNRPAERVTWNDALLFCKKLSKKEGVKYRLPTEAEWEYACRAGTKTEYYWGDKMDGKYAWYCKNSKGKTHDVGKKKPNAWGLYDMSGNLSEWCSDWYARNYYDISPGKNPQGPKDGKFRVLRGGRLDTFTTGCSSASRSRSSSHHTTIHVGFRIVREAE